MKLNAHAHQHVAVTVCARGTLQLALSALASMGKTFEAKCNECSKCFYSFTSEKSARSCRDRHFREVHTLGALRWRRACNARRQAAARLVSSASEHADGASLRLFILCPLRREKMLGLFTAARLSFASIGVPPQYVRRLQGVDLARRDLRDEHPRACTVVGCALFRIFVPAANAIFAANPRVRYILFAEDDCRLARDVSLEHLIESCRTACSLRKPAWLAFKQRRGKPNFGAHLLAFSRCSLNVFVKDAAAKDPCGTLALDTLLRALWQEGRVWTPRKSLAVQALHALKGRR